MTIHIAPLMAVIVVGCTENSFSTLCHAMAVHNRKAFHAVRNNTSHSSRVTRKGGLLIVWIWVENAKGLKRLSKREQAKGAVLSVSKGPRCEALFGMASGLKA